MKSIVILAASVMMAATAAATAQTNSLTYKIVDTEQETFYNNSSEINEPNAGDSFYGQDAQFNGNQPDYTDNGDGTITDNNTGLMWQKYLLDDKFTYEEALENAESFDLAGYDDWRLPTIKELYSLMMFYGRTFMTEEESTPYIDTDYFDFRFGGAVDPSERFIDAQWASSTTYVGEIMNGQDGMFGLNLADGRIKCYPLNKSFEVFYVRGNTEYGKNNFVDNSDNTIIDLATGLMWDKNGSSEGMNWEEALEWAHTMNQENYLGYSDWRLPNAKELHSLVDYNRSPSTTNSAAIDPVFNVPSITNEGGDEDYPFYWIGTTHFDGPIPNKAVNIAFGRALGFMSMPPTFDTELLDVHGAGAQRSDPKEGDPSDYPEGFGPQGDVQRIYNYVRLVRNADIDSTDNGGNSGIDTTRSSYTLFAPLGNTTTYLIDESGNVYKSWESEYTPALSAYLVDDNTSLLRTASLGRNGNIVFGNTGGAGGKVEMYDWDGNITWEFEHSSENYLLHHDIEQLPNGNILMIAWEYKSEQEAFDAGRDPSLLSDGELWPDKIIEVEPTGNSGGHIIWEWHVWDHLVQNYDASKDNYGVVSEHPKKINLNFVDKRAIADWNHCNAIDYNEELDQIMITSHSFSEIWIIDHNTTTEEAAGSKGDLLYRWGNPQTYNKGTSSDQIFFGPHDGRWIPADYPGGGDILIFNNGMGRNYSSVDQFTPPVDANGNYQSDDLNGYAPETLTWTYISTPETDFYADHISGAQRLKNGNTLICSGTSGEFFEVTDDGETVWEYSNPYAFTTPQGNTVNEVFRATRYYLNESNDNGGITDISDEDQFGEGLPDEFSLSQNYPNPFNPTTNISFSLPRNENVTLKIYNMLGELVSTLVNANLSAGSYSYQWNAANYASGMYIYRLQAGSFVSTKKLILMK